MDEEKNVSGHITAAQLKEVAESQKTYIDNKFLGVDEKISNLDVPSEATAEEILEICNIFAIDQDANGLL